MVRVLLLEDTHPIPRLYQLMFKPSHLGVVRLSRASYRKTIQNLTWAAGYNIVAIPLAAGALAWAGITLSPAVGAVLMSLSTIVVALNAQLLRRVQLSNPS